MATRGRVRGPVTAGGTTICPKCNRRSMVINNAVGTCLHRGCEHNAPDIEGWHCRWSDCQGEGTQRAGSGWTRGSHAWRHYMDNHHGRPIPTRQ